MKLRNHNYKDSLRQTIKEEIQNQLFLQEIFDSSPFKTEFIFFDYGYEIKCETFKDNQGNNIQVIFHKLSSGFFEIDFIVNGNSYENSDIDYSLKEYTSLISTVFKCIEQFIEEYSPQGVKIEGEDSFTKQEKGKKGQKNTIYKYALQNIDVPPNYVFLTDESGGVEILKK
jgi:hypothetical protein